jgi:hypothetical protein
MESLTELQGKKGEWRSYLHGLNLLAAGLLLVAGAFWYTRRPPSSASWHFTAVVTGILVLGTFLLEIRIRRDLIGPSRHERVGAQLERSGVGP